MGEGDPTAATNSDGGPVKLLVLGGEAAGKTTLVEQLRAMAAGGMLSDGPSLNVAPTTGQEVDTVTFPAAVVRAVTRGTSADAGAAPTSARPATRPQASEQPGGGGDDARYMPGAILDDDDDAAAKPAARPPPVVRTSSAADPSEPHCLTGTGPVRDVTVSIKEFGGAMAPVWPRLMAGSDCGRALIFVIDASNPTMLPTSAIELLELFASEQAGCLSWKVLILINKITMPSALHPNDVAGLCCLPQLQQAHPDADIAVLACDTWSGEGLDHVLRWVLAIGSPGAASRTVAAAAPYAPLHLPS
eukprot:CAMPEP_0174856680 /NCGR_PEP_ID=MMETSP1114-20130205/36164_1 /TAXON_ID=312471 /ORGANISM="Neobodo designis, Strain CCAP 1951/1" /LENGTH=302 /DNA_ID=CAMNT_0016091485 /DNA_START=46 /DNA_END=954 /DNA_ORIENTATION=+